ncbi:MAG: hypothetical protein KKB51_03245 [Candidatus Riflebacteria bacterium]|nr:hypothetical protein [Candidatus Riflebacteria bacterium]
MKIKSFWVIWILLFVVFLWAGIIGYSGLCLWNMYQDLQPSAFFYPGLKTKEFSLTKRIGYLDEKLLTCFEELQKSSGTAIPGSYTFFLASIPDSKTISKEIIDFVASSTRGFPDLAPPPSLPGKSEIFDFLSGGVTDTAKAWMGIALGTLNREKPMNSGLILLGISLIAYQIEVEIEGNYWLMDRMEGNLCRELAADGFVQCAEPASFSKEDIKILISNLQTLEGKLPPLQQIFPARLNYLLAWGKLLKSAVMRAKTSSSFRWGGAILSDYLLSPAFTRFYQKQIIDSLKETASKSWAESVSERAAIHERILALAVKGRKPNPAWWMYVFIPMQFLFDREEMIAMEAFEQYSLNDRKASQKLRMAQWALALHGFRRNEGRWPVGQEEIETWLGCGLPGDVFSGKPLLFRVGTFPDVRSIGPDLIADTSDDLSCDLFRK